MPELPEVETIARGLRNANLIGLGIDKAHVFWDRSIAHPGREQFVNAISGQRILDIDRRGKHLIFRLSRDTLLVHLRMTGKFLISTDALETDSHERVRLVLSDGRILRYEDQRKFGKWILTNRPETFLDKIGIEPLSSEFTLAAFQACLKGKNRQIKPFLLDQTVIAGLGNIYVDEALWAAKVHPERSASTLSAKEMRELHSAIIDVLEKGLQNAGTSLGLGRSNYMTASGSRGSNQQALQVFRREGLPCHRCHTPIEKMVVAQRGTHYCPHCQLPKSSR